MHFSMVLCAQNIEKNVGQNSWLEKEDPEFDFKKKNNFLNTWMLSESLASIVTGSPTFSFSPDYRREKRSLWAGKSDARLVLKDANPTFVKKY